MTRRHKPTMKQKLDTALLQLGLDPERARLDHSPPLALREQDSEGAYIPPENDPRYMQWLDDGGKERPAGSHNRKTYGTSATSAGSDAHAIAKVRRVSKKQAEFRRRLLAKDAGEPPPRSKWGKRPMGRR